MDVNLIFKIAAIGIIISVLNTVLVRSGRRSGNADNSCRCNRCAYDAYS